MSMGPIGPGKVCGHDVEVQRDVQSSAEGYSDASISHDVSDDVQEKIVGLLRRRHHELSAARCMHRGT